VMIGGCTSVQDSAAQQSDHARDYEFALGVKADKSKNYPHRSGSIIDTFNRLSEWRTVYDNIDWVSFSWDVPAYLGQNDPEALKAIMDKINARGIKLQAGGRALNRLNGRRDILPRSARMMYDLYYQHIIEAGGKIGRIVVDNYFNKCLPNGQLDKCNFSVEHAINGFEEYVHILRELIPGVKIAIVEASWTYSWGKEYGAANPKRSRGDLKKILTELTSRNVLDAYFMECAYSHTHPHSKAYDGFKRNKVIADWCRANGLRFGLLMEDNVGGRTSNRLFSDNVMKMYNAYAKMGLKPDTYFFLSWFPHPNKTLPEQEDYTHMNGALRLLKEIQRDRPGD